jgi:hypothetical protein
VTQHSGLTPERWARFGLPQQILQIALELQRGLHFLRRERLVELRCCYERALALVDLTVAVQTRPALRRELLRWRGLVAELYLGEEPAPERHRQALKLVLQLNPESARHVALLGL